MHTKDGSRSWDRAMRRRSGQWRWAWRAGVGVGVAALALVVLPSGQDLARGVEMGQARANAAAERFAYGLPNDEATLDRLLGQPADVGTPKWGIPMTAQEEEAIDLPGRMLFADAVANEVLPVLRARSDFGGAWLDQRENGGLVVALTSFDEATANLVGTLMPATSRGLRLQLVEHSEARLLAALDAVIPAWAAEGGARLHSAGVDTQHNGLVVRLVDPAGTATKVADRVGARLGLPVRVVLLDHDGGDVVHQDQVCSSRENCYNPYEAGILIRGGSTSGVPCTMAWPILVGTDIQFVTAGHCGHYASSWYHQGDGFIGAVKGNQWAADGRDIMRVQIPNGEVGDREVSEAVYGTSNCIGCGHEQLMADSSPVLGEVLCASLGRTNRYDCARVEDTALKYWSDTIGFYVKGGEACRG